MVDWAQEISRIVSWKQLIADRDSLHAFPWHLPRVGAKLEQITQAENVVGVEFSQQFREFLTLANGWQGLVVSTDLFGTKEFVEGKAREVLKRKELLAFLREHGLSSGQVVPIGASEFDLDVFILISPSSSFMPGGVLWFANEEVDRFSSFAEFLASMAAYNERIAQKLAQESKGS